MSFAALALRARAANDTTRAQINNIPSKSHVIPLLITLIKEKDKDKRKISNWRPIALINVDVKIGSKAIALRLQTVLPKIVHHNQHANVK